MMIDVTREELRADMREIASEVVQEVVKDNNRTLIRMINEDLGAISQRIDRLDRRSTKHFKQIDQRFDAVDQRFDIIEHQMADFREVQAETNDKLDFTHKLLHVHIANPSAHAPGRR